MGATPSFTCTPYEVFDLPQKGKVVSFVESNAAVFSNSLLGLKTNKESALSALASSVTGKRRFLTCGLKRQGTPKSRLKVILILGLSLTMGFWAILQARQSKTVMSNSTPSTNQTPYRQRHFVQQWARQVPVACSLLEARQKKKFPLEKKRPKRLWMS